MGARRDDRFVEVLIFLAVYLSTATQLRFAGPVGLGELCGLTLIIRYGWAVFSGVRTVVIGRSSIAPLAVFFAAMGMGWILNLMTGFSETEQLRDVAAMSYAFALGLAVTNSSAENRRCFRALLAGLTLSVLTQIILVVVS